MVVMAVVMMAIHGSDGGHPEMKTPLISQRLGEVGEISSLLLQGPPPFQEMLLSAYNGTERKRQIGFE